jgi:sugar O-acyltransferase (sialic acid O-acetyltransferase NeuD family)
MNERPAKTDKIVIVGDSAFAQIAYEYFTYDSCHEVAAFAVERDYLKREELFGLPVVPFEELELHYSPSGHKFFAALTYTQHNRLRSRLYHEAKNKGFLPVSYISSKAFVWRNCRVGEHCFVFENNVIQPFVSIGDDVVLWSGNHVGHHSTIGNHCFLSSHVVISGFVDVGEYCFLGVNSTIVHNVEIGKGCTIGAGSLVLDDVGDEQTVVGTRKKLKTGEEQTVA